MKKAALALVLVLASIGLVACGGSSSSSSSSSSSESTATETTAEGSTTTGGAATEGKSAGGASTIEFEADPKGNLAYTKAKTTAKAGNDTIKFTNPQPLPHDVAIENSAGKTIAKTETVAEGSDSTTVTLKPGTYHYYCTVPGHREAGMEGVLTVK